MNGPNLRKRGTAGEEIASAFLRKNGYEILEQNYYYQHGEIDIVADDHGTLVFVEVKSRRNLAYGAPEESVTPKKQELLRRTAEGYVAERQIGDRSCRFDVVAVTMRNGDAECRLFKDCF